MNRRVAQCRESDWNGTQLNCEVSRVLAPRLIQREANGRERAFDLKSSTSIGRAPDNDIVFVNEHSISRRHARIIREGGDYYLLDCGSKNGTKLNGRLIERERLTDNDQVLLGKIVLTFREPSTGKVRRATIVDDDKRLDHVGTTLIRSLDELMAEDEISSFDQFRVFPHAPAEQRPHVGSQPLLIPKESSDIEKNNLKLKIMYRVASKLNTAPTLEKFLEDVLDMAFQVVGAERGVLKLTDNKDYYGGVEVVRFSDPSMEENITISKTITDAAINQRVAILVHDAQIDKRFCLEDSVQLYGIRSALCVPVWHQTKSYGFLYVDCLLSSKSFVEEDMELLTALANQAAIGIEKARLDEAYKEESRRRDHLARYFSPRVVDVIINKKSAREIEEREVTVMFADIRGFTSLSENLPQSEIVELLNEFLDLSTRCIFEYEGTLDKFMGDCVMALFGVPLALPDAAERAIGAALDIQAGLFRSNKEQKERCRLDMRIGINTGRAIVGDIGPDSRLEFTVLGDSVNMASRLQSEVAGTGQIIIGERTYQQTFDKFIFRELGDYRVKGKQKHCRVYEALGRRSSSFSVRSATVSGKQAIDRILAS